jgi:hypothetical protein
MRPLLLAAALVVMSGGAMAQMPTSPVGLKPGAMWNNGGMISVIPPAPGNPVMSVAGATQVRDPEERLERIEKLLAALCTNQWKAAPSCKDFLR